MVLQDLDKRIQSRWQYSGNCNINQVFKKGHFKFYITYCPLLDEFEEAGALVGVSIWSDFCRGALKAFSCLLLRIRLLSVGGGISGIPEVSPVCWSGMSGKVPLGIPISSSSPIVNMCFENGCIPDIFYRQTFLECTKTTHTWNTRIGSFLGVYQMEVERTGRFSVHIGRFWPDWYEILVYNCLTKKKFIVFSFLY